MKRMVVCSSDDRCAQVSTYGAVKQETPLPDDPVSEHTQGMRYTLVKKMFLGCVSLFQLQHVTLGCFGRCDSDYKCKEIMAGNIRDWM